MNEISNLENNLKYSNNLKHVNSINNEVFLDNDFQYVIRLNKGKVFMNNSICGYYNFNTQENVTSGLLTRDRIERIIELSTSCQHSEFKSSSPSMILHQISLMTFVDLMPGSKSIEDFQGNRRNDIIWNYQGRKVIVEITGTNYQSRFNKLNRKINRDIMTINKYSFNPMTKDVDNIRILSLENDKRSIESIYQKAVIQSESVSKRLFYDRRILKFFIKTPNLHVKACEDAFLEYCHVTKEKVDESVDPTCEYVTECVGKLTKGLSEMMSKEMTDRDYYAFDLNLLRGFNYKDEEHTEYLPPRAECVDGNLEFPRPEKETIQPKLFINTEICSMTDGAYNSTINYPEVKRVREDYITKHIAEIIDRYQTVTNLYCLLNSLCLRTYGQELMKYRPKKRRIHSRIRPQTPYKPEDFNRSLDMMNMSTYNVEMDPDPDHIKIITESGSPKFVVSIFNDSRDVFELRMKKRIALSALRIRRPMRPFRVFHWKNRSIYADCIIMGKLFQKDSGVMYVSYYTDYRLIKTQKWRLPDVENFSVGPERAVALTSSIGCRGLTYEVSRKALTLYYRLLNENSWGVSKFLKPYRYFSSGIAMGSSRTHEQIPKMLKEANSYLSDKLSIRYLNHLLKNSECVPGRTPALDLTFEDIGYECFIINLCPSKTYGSSRHLVNVLKELSDEVILYNQSYDNVKRIYDDFTCIISSNSSDREYLKRMYLDHLKLIDRFNLINDGRFTFTPASLLLCKREIDNLNLRPELNKPPSIDELATARGSTSNFSNEPKMALESINEISRKMNSSSTTRLAIRILERQPVDLTMRMFDKDQVGGDREISILNAGFRILQSVSESFFKILGSQSGVDLLADKHKTLNYTKSISECLCSRISRLLTIDQTRWGPNFNTITFGLLALMTSHLSTEYMIPAIVCLISEFKVFEMPIMEPELYGLQEISYSLPGIVGRSHMGQGIFHYASSFYHSLSLLSIKRLFYKTYKLRPSNCVIRTFCTSDDASIVAYNSTSCKDSDLNYVSEKIRYLYSFFENIIHLYGIKTNKTKNIDSKTTIEFNSMYYSRCGIGSNDIKFLYSLIDPTTTGNIYRDSNMVYMVFDRAVNSGCTIENSVIISKCVYLIKLRQWSGRGHIVKPPNYELICTGSDILEPQEPNISDQLYFTTGLSFARKRRIKEEYFKSEDTYSLTQIKQEANMESMLNSKISEKFRSMQTYNNICKVAVPTTSVFRSLAPDSITMSNEFFMREFFSSSEVIKILKASNQKISTTLYQKCWTRPTMFTFKIIKQRRLHDFDPMSYLISLSDPVHSLLNLDCQDKLILHLYRKRNRYHLEEDVIDEYKNLCISERIRKLTKLRIELELSSPNVIQMVYNPGCKSIEYTRQIRNWNRSAASLSRLMKIICVNNVEKIKHSVCFTNTESITAYYHRYDIIRGDFTEFIPSSLAEWPQVSIRETILKLSDLYVSEKILKILCTRERECRESRSEKLYLVVRKRIDKSLEVNGSLSQFTYDISTYKDDNLKDDYCSLEIDKRYSYLATSYVLRQAMILSTVEHLMSMGACVCKDIDSLISGKYTITTFTRGLFDDLDWLITEKLTILSSEKGNQDLAKNFLFDAYYNIIELENENYFPIYAMLSVTHPHYISFRPRGTVLNRSDFSVVMSQLVTDDSIVDERSEILRIEYPEQTSSDYSGASTLTSYDISDSLNDRDDIGSEYYDNLAKNLDSVVNYGNIDDVEKDESLMRNNIEEMLNLINLKMNDDSDYFSDSSYED